MKIKITLNCKCGDQRHIIKNKTEFKEKWLPLFPNGIRHYTSGALDFCSSCGEQVRITMINDWNLAKEINCYFEGVLKNALKDPCCASCGRVPSLAGKEPLICLPNNEIDSWQLFCSMCALEKLSPKNAGVIANLWNRNDIRITHKGVVLK